MLYNVDLTIINPDTLKAQDINCILDIDILSPDYEDIVTYFFKRWDKKDKYDICYAIGVKHMELYDNKK